MQVRQLFRAGVSKSAIARQLQIPRTSVHAFSPRKSSRAGCYAALPKGHMYIFRAAANGSILVDRYVLDGLTNTLIRTLDVRFKRSGKRYEPLESDKGEDIIDALDFRDVEAKPFYEPTIELTLINGIHAGRFAVVLVPTADPEKSVWHFFTIAKTGLELTSIRAGADGLFDVADSEGRAGIIRRNIDISNFRGSPPNFHSIAATRYDRRSYERTAQVRSSLCAIRRMSCVH
jgi:hypothetical protein